MLFVSLLSIRIPILVQYLLFNNITNIPSSFYLFSLNLREVMNTGDLPTLASYYIFASFNYNAVCKISQGCFQVMNG